MSKLIPNNRRDQIIVKTLVQHYQIIQIIIMCYVLRNFHLQRHFGRFSGIT